MADFLLRYQEHCSVPQIHEQLQQRGITIAERSVGHLIDRYDELVTLYLNSDQRWQTIFASQAQVILAIDGMQMWDMRCCG